MRRRFPTTLALLPLFLGCLGTPQPDPPNLFVDPALVFGSGSDGDPTVALRGDPGAILPAEATLRITSLDRTAPPVDATPALDGSFDAIVPGEVGEEFRLQALLDGERSVPVDVVVGEGHVSAAPRPLADCLTTSPDLQATVVQGTRATIRLRNDCGVPAVVSRIAIRSVGSPFSVISPSAPADLPSGGELAIVVELPSTMGELPEDVLLLETSTPSIDRRPITLVGER